MSSGVEVIILAPFIAQLLAGGVVAGAAAGAALSSTAVVSAYNVLQRFDEQLEKSRLEYERRMNEQQAETAAGAAAVAATRIAERENANLTFLRQGIKRLSERLPQLPDPSPSLAAECIALEQAVAKNPSNFADLFARYLQFSQAITQAAAHQKSHTATTDNQFSSELTEVRDLLASPLFQSRERAVVKKQLSAALTELEALVTTQPALVAQGLQNLRDRLNHELHEQAKRTEARIQESAQLREVLGAVIPKLQTISLQATLPDQQRAAEQLLQRLAALLSGNDPNILAELSALAADTEKLFQQSRQTLADRVQSQYLADQVSDVLLSMGYDVNQVPGEGEQRTMTAVIDAEHGVQFSVDANGKLQTEAVAFNDAATEFDSETEKHVCSLVDQVLEHLRARQCNVRERFRRYGKNGSRLRVVQRAKAAAAPRAEALKQRKVDEA